MADIVFVAVVLAFFTICVLYVNWCDRIIGADDDSLRDTSNPTDSTSPINPVNTDTTDNTDKQEIAA